MSKPRQGRPKALTSSVRAQRAYKKAVLFNRQFLDVKQHIALLERNQKAKPHMRTLKEIFNWKEKLVEMEERKKVSVADNFIGRNTLLVPVDMIDAELIHNTCKSLLRGEANAEFTLLSCANARKNHTVVAMLDLVGLDQTLCMIKEEYRNK